MYGSIICACEQRQCCILVVWIPVGIIKYHREFRIGKDLKGKSSLICRI